MGRLKLVGPEILQLEFILRICNFQYRSILGQKILGI